MYKQTTTTINLALEAMKIAADIICSNPEKYPQKAAIIELASMIYDWLFTTVDY